MYENITFEVILQRMLDRVPNTVDKREGSIIYNALAPAAVELQNAYIEYDWILNQSFADTAERNYLIRRCAERGIIVEEATKTILQGNFNIDIPIGSRFSLNDLNYKAIEKISTGVFKMECETAGEIGNQNFGTLIPIEYIDGLTSAELTAVLIPGEDEEDTEVLRTRYFDSFETNPYGGNKEDYIQKTKSISGVGAVKVTRVWNSNISPASMIPTAMVIAWYQSIIGNLDLEVANWLSTIYNAAIEKKLTVGGTVLITILNSEFEAASEILIDTVQTALDPVQNAGEGVGIAPIGHIVNVDTATEIIINIEATLTMDTGYTWEMIESSVLSTLQAYMLEIRTDWENQNQNYVRISQIETRILAIAGVIDITGTKINGLAQNLTLNSFEIPILGTVTAL